MTRFIAKRLGLALITLLILSAIVFILGSLLPGDPGRSTLGPLAPESAVKALDHQYGTDKPLLTQYWLFISHFVRGDMGTSNIYHSAVRPLLFTAIGHSLKLAILAFIIVVPLGIAAGVFAALHVGKASDRAIVVLGSSAGTVKDVVDALRADGEHVGLLKIRSFLPFPAEALRHLLGDLHEVIVLDRADSPGGAPPLGAAVAFALHGYATPVRSHVYGLGGRDLHPEAVRDVFLGCAPHYLGVRGDECLV